MTNKPLVNAFLATLYIVSIASFMFFGLARSHPDDTVFAPIAFLSLFTLSAAVMGYIFLYQPILLLVEGQKKKAASLFLQTVGYFGAITFLVLILIFSGYLK